MKSGTTYLLATMPCTLLVLAVIAYGAIRNGVASLLPVVLFYALLASLLWLCRLIAKKKLAGIASNRPAVAACRQEYEDGKTLMGSD